jgi:hypothetical protein
MCVPLTSFDAPNVKNGCLQGIFFEAALEGGQNRNRFVCAMHEIGQIEPGEDMALNKLAPILR